MFDWFDDGNLNRKEVKGIDRNQNNEVKEKSEREEKSEHEEEEEKQDDGITPGGDEDGVKGKGKDEPISLFNETKKGDDDGAGTSS